MTRHRRWVQNTDGTAMVEFGIIALPFLALIIGALQVMIIMWTQEMLETATEALGRRVLTGIVQKSALTKSQFGTLACSLLPTTMDCSKLIIDVQVASTFSLAVVTKPDLSAIGNPTTTTVLNYNVGTGGNIVVMRVLYALPVVSIPGLNLQSSVSAYGFNFPMATAVFKNEVSS